MGAKIRLLRLLALFDGGRQMAQRQSGRRGYLGKSKRFPGSSQIVRHLVQGARGGGIPAIHKQAAKTLFKISDSTFETLAIGLPQNIESLFETVGLV